MSNEAEVPPQRLYYKLVNGNWQRVMPSPDTIEYVPASARDAVWEKAISIARGWATSPSCNEDHTDSPCCHVRTGAGIAAALEAARDAALSAGKENNRESISETTDTQRR